MLTNVDIWNDQESGDVVQAESRGNGRLVLRFHIGSVDVSILSSKRALVSASLGGKSHFASIEGACEFNRVGDDLEITAQPWSGPRECVSVNPRTFQVAVQSLTDTPYKDISVL
jgi:hypothetical protein